ncbi:hypothetical protein [Azospirillum argentinense]|uniref:Uncharacterized protein n=1 Tax=Azospirillum brasilense TaxID=192 RepID=A0A4D8QKR5_AZOBR|nr:hypothetical protein [Azospirillum argentinense]QCO07449.1 hypothetical protein D3867_36815 [Azospirillum argentinense]
MPVTRTAEKDRRREQARARRREVIDRVIAALEALQAAGVPGRLVLPVEDDQPVHLLIDATSGPSQALAAWLVRRAMGDVLHTLLFTGDLALDSPEALDSIRRGSLPLEALRCSYPAQSV